MPTAGTEKASSPKSGNDLDKLLALVNNNVTIKVDTLPNNLIGEVLTAFNRRKPLEILNAAKTVASDGVTIKGTATFLGVDEVKITANFMLNGDFTLTLDAPSMSLATLLAPASGPTLTRPPHFDVTLPETIGIIACSSGQLTFTAAANDQSLGELLFQATKGTGTSWNALAGLELQIQKLADLPALTSSPLAAFDNFAGLTNIVMVLSTQAVSGFPDVAQFKAPTLNLSNITLPDQVTGLVAGFNIYAKLKTANTEPFKLLAKYLQVNLNSTVGITLSVSLPDPGASKLSFSVNQTILDTGIPVDGIVGGALNNGVVDLFLAGTATLPIQQQPVVFALELVVLPTGLLLEGSMQNPVPIQFSFEGIKFQLSNVAVVVGIDEEDVPSFGFAATVDIDSLNGSAALFFNSSSPAQSMFLGAMTGLTLYDVAGAYAGQQNLQNLPSELVHVLRKIALTGLSSFNVPGSDATKLVTALDQRDMATIVGSFQTHGNVRLSKTSLLEINQPSALVPDGPHHANPLPADVRHGGTGRGSARTADLLCAASHSAWDVAVQPAIDGQWRGGPLHCERHTQHQRDPSDRTIGQRHIE